MRRRLDRRRPTAWPWLAAGAALTVLSTGIFMSSASGQAPVVSTAKGVPAPVNSTTKGAPAPAAAPADPYYNQLIRNAARQASQGQHLAATRTYEQVLVKWPGAGSQCGAVLRQPAPVRDRPATAQCGGPKRGLLIPATMRRCRSPSSDLPDRARRPSLIRSPAATPRPAAMAASR